MEKYIKRDRIISSKMDAHSSIFLPKYFHLDTQIYQTTLTTDTCFSILYSNVLQISFERKLCSMNTYDRYCLEKNVSNVAALLTLLSLKLRN
jgi:hypothetical protein